MRGFWITAYFISGKNRLNCGRMKPPSHLKRIRIKVRMQLDISLRAAKPKELIK